MSDAALLGAQGITSRNAQALQTCGDNERSTKSPRRVDLPDIGVVGAGGGRPGARLHIVPATWPCRIAHKSQALPCHRPPGRPKARHGPPCLLTSNRPREAGRALGRRRSVLRRLHLQGPAPTGDRGRTECRWARVRPPSAPCLARPRAVWRHEGLLVPALLLASAPAAERLKNESPYARLRRAEAAARTASLARRREEGWAVGLDGRLGARRGRCSVERATWTGCAAPRASGGCPGSGTTGAGGGSCACPCARRAAFGPRRGTASWTRTARPRQRRGTCKPG